jgi:hypothetical protein
MVNLLVESTERMKLEMNRGASCDVAAVEREGLTANPAAGIQQ